MHGIATAFLLLCHGLTSVLAAPATDPVDFVVDLTEETSGLVPANISALNAVATTDLALIVIVENGFAIDYIDIHTQSTCYGSSRVGAQNAEQLSVTRGTASSLKCHVYRLSKCKDTIFDRKWTFLIHWGPGAMYSTFDLPRKMKHHAGSFRCYNDLGSPL